MHAGKASERWKVGAAVPPGVFVGMLNSSSEAVVVTEQGLGQLECDVALSLRSNGNDIK